MATLMAPDPTRAGVPRLQRFGSAEDMRKEASLMAPVSASRTSGTPGPTPAPQRASVSHPHGRVPSFTSMLLNVVFDGIVNNQFTSLDIAYEHQTDLLARLQAKRLLSDDNIALFSSQSELVLSNCAITDKGIHKLFEKQDSRSVRTQ